MSAQTAIDVDSLEAGWELDALIAERVFGRRVSVWSLHAIFSADELQGRAWMHTNASPYCLSKGIFPCEVLFADAEGDMPSLDMLDGGMWRSIQPYSTDIKAAWEVAEKMRLTVTPGYDSTLGDCWLVGRCNWSASGETNAVGMTNGREWVKAKAAELAICRAALKAIQS